MNKLVLLLGGNLGDREEILNEATQIISYKVGKIVVCSSFYETEAWGFESETMFLNKVIVLDTSFTAQESLNICQNIEKKLGRIRHKERYSSRVIDIDLLFFNNDIIEEINLEIPHPRIQERRFVLEPLNEIMTDYEHPLLKKKISTLLQTCTDSSIVYKLS